MLSIQTPRELLAAMQKLQSEVLADADELFTGWQSEVTRVGFEASAQNLASYLALRRHELPPLQLALMRWGLSSLGRSESRVRVTLDAVIATLGAVCGLDANTLPLYPAEHEVFRGAESLEREAHSMFGSVDTKRRTRILVTLPSEAAEDLTWMHALVKARVDCVRINCAHDDAEAWRKMIQNLRLAERERESREPIRVLMDLGGPKVRTTRRPMDEEERYLVGDKLLLTTASNLEHTSKHHRKHHGGGPAARRRLHIARTTGALAGWRERLHRRRSDRRSRPGARLGRRRDRDCSCAGQRPEDPA